MAVYRKFSQEDLDREYSPSSCVEDINVYLHEYVRLSELARDVAADHGSSELDLQYGRTAEEALDLFMPPDCDSAPLHVYIHGGYWQLLSKDESSFAATMFQDHGSCVAVINYTLAPRQTLTGIVEECRRSIAWLYENASRFGYDRKRIHLSGSSAGAHLCMMLLLTEWARFGLPANAISGVCAVSGIYDLEPVQLSYVNDKVGMDVAEAIANSPIRHDLRNGCPVIFAYGDNETAEFKRQTDEYRDKLAGEGWDIEFAEVPDRNHFDVILDLADADSRLARAVLRQMSLGAQGSYMA